jgi:hypothetical protein
MRYSVLHCVALISLLKWIFDFFGTNSVLAATTLETQTHHRQTLKQTEGLTDKQKDR